MPTEPQRRGSYDDLFEAVRQLFQAYYPGWSPGSISIHCKLAAAPDREQRITLLMPSAPERELTEAEEDILDAIGDDTLRGKEIAAKLGRPASGRLRSLLASMVRKGLLAQGPEGYSVP